MIFLMSAWSKIFSTPPASCSYSAYPLNAWTNVSDSVLAAFVTTSEITLPSATAPAARPAFMPLASPCPDLPPSDSSGSCRLIFSFASGSSFVVTSTYAVPTCVPSAISQPPFSV